MRVLLSAYACEPGKGSEPGVGWNWAVEIARLGHEVHVLTRANNRSAIDAALASGNYPRCLHFHYHDLPKWQRFWKRGGRGVLLYNLIWQWGAFRVAKHLHCQVAFDLVHHITFGSVRLPTFMWGLRTTLFLGPLGGGEVAPYRLRQHFPLRGKLIDRLRDMSNLLASVDPLMVVAYSRASRIFLKTEDSKKCVPKMFWGKCTTSLEIGTSSEPQKRCASRSPDGAVRVLFVGRHVYWKGMGLGLQAFALAIEQCPNLRLTMVGDGPELHRWKVQATRLGLEGVVNWMGWLAKDEVMSVYDTHDVFLFPSLHDSSGNVVLEAASHGLPVLCLDTGGPGSIVNARCGVKVPVADCSEGDVVRKLAQEIVNLAMNGGRRARLSDSARRWARSQSWATRAEEIYANVGTVPA